MRRVVIAVLGVCALSGVGFVNAGGPAQPFLTPGLQGWEGLMEYWSYRNGVLTGAAPKGLTFNTFLCSKRKYKDFELSFQVKLTGTGANSGVQIRSEIFDRKTFAVKGPQCDMGQIYWGSLYGELFGGMMKQAPEALVKKVLKKDDFNDYYIQCVGTHVTIKLNGETTVSDDFPKMPPEGIIAFQLHAGKPMEAVFRNIQFVDLSETPTPPTPTPPIAGAPPAPCQGVIYTDGPCDYWYCPPRRLFGRFRR
jgi:hypothetical protein